jgi:hypothetical protein
MAPAAGDEATQEIRGNIVVTSTRATDQPAVLTAEEDRRPAFDPGLHALPLIGLDDGERRCIDR